MQNTKIFATVLLPNNFAFLLIVYAHSSTCKMKYSLSFKDYNQ